MCDFWRFTRDWHKRPLFNSSCEGWCGCHCSVCTSLSKALHCSMDTESTLKFCFGIELDRLSVANAFYLGHLVHFLFGNCVNILHINVLIPNLLHKHSIPPLERLSLDKISCLVCVLSCLVFCIWRLSVWDTRGSSIASSWSTRETSFLLELAGLCFDA